MDSEKFEIDLGNSFPNIRQSGQNDFVTFWENEARSLSWFKHWDKTLDWNPPFAKWFEGGLLNASYNTLDIHQKGKADKTAIFWEGEDGSQRDISYSELLTHVKKFANALKSLGVEKGDRVTIYLPMVPELVISMLGCARIGAIHTVVFSGFSATSLKDRIDDSKSKIIITADGGFRKGKIIKLKDIVDNALSETSSVEHLIVLERIKHGITLEPIFTHSSNHYIRIYLKRVSKTLPTIKKRVRPIFYCRNCINFKISKFFTNSKKRCACGEYFEQLGPMWIGRLWDNKLVQKIEGNKTIELIKGESKLNVFGYFDYHSIAKNIKNKVDLPKMKILIEKINKKGYIATRTHFSPTGIRSNIPPRTFLKLLTK